MTLKKDIPTYPDACPVVMGILNVTPDSFSGDGITDVGQAVKRGMELAEQGADILDIGGESSRPYADPVTIEEELRRVIPVIRELTNALSIPISIDTRHPVVAKEAIRSGAVWINDISGLHEPDMIRVAAETGSRVIIMHMKGTPQTMQQLPEYRDVTLEVCEYLLNRAMVAEAAGIPRTDIVMDPGIGFGKSLHHNLELLRNVERIKDLGYPVLVGTSRKSFIGHIVPSSAQDRLEGTLASVGYLMMKGVDIIRVHDVKSVVRFIKVWRAIAGGQEKN